MSGPEFQGGLSLGFLCQSRCAANSTVREYSQIIKDLVHTHTHTHLYIHIHTDKCTDISGLNYDAFFTMTLHLYHID